MQIKILSINVWRGNHLDKISSFLKSAEADIIGLQEIHETTTEKGTENFAQMIAEELGYNVSFCKAFFASTKTPPYDYGNAILSRFPIGKTICHQLSGLDEYQGNATTEPRGAIEAQFTIEGKRLHVFNTHLSYSHELKPWVLRAKQITNLAKVLPDTNTVLIGDFNATPDNPDMKPLASKVINADPQPTQGTWSVYPVDYHGFVVKGLDYRIDHIFVTKDINVSKFTIEDTKGSDHLAVSCVLSTV